MTNFEQVTQSRETLAAFLGTLPVLEGPWNTEFQKRFCSSCPAENCDACPHSAERDNPGWWLDQQAADCTKSGADSLCITPDPDNPAADRRGTTIEIDPQEITLPMTPEEQAAAEDLRHMSRYAISYTDELTEADIDTMEATEERKAVLRFLAEHNPEKRVVRITPGAEPWILLHGEADVQSFINAVREMSRRAFEGEGDHK